MKLLFCPRCHDLFKLSMKLKSCNCGMCKGKYINDSEAVTNGQGISVAIGNGSLLSAIENMKEVTDPSKKNREWWIENARIEYAWVRPNEGIGNPHASVDEEL